MAKLGAQATSRSASLSGCRGNMAAFNRRSQAVDGHAVGVIDWGECWKCHRPLGCSTCTTSNAAEILCRMCGAWGTERAFLHHGPIRESSRVPSTPFAAYPASWRAKYEADPREEKRSAQQIFEAATPRRSQ